RRVFLILRVVAEHDLAPIWEHHTVFRESGLPREADVPLPVLLLPQRLPLSRDILVNRPLLDLDRDVAVLRDCPYQRIGVLHTRLYNSLRGPLSFSRPVTAKY